jgi:transposase-like protein
VGVSATIQSRRHIARHAAQPQKWPGDLIEATESAGETLEGSCSRNVHTFYEHRNRYGINAPVVGVDSPGGAFVTVLTAGTKVLLLSTAWPTTAPELLDLNEYQAENSWSRWAGQAKEALQKGADQERRSSTAAARLRVERLSALQAAFGFTIQDLASVLGITRPQLYKWLDAANDIKLQEASRTRLATVERIAKEWTSRAQAPLNAVSKEPLNAGGNVFAMLSASVINEANVIATFDELMGKLQTKPKTLSLRLREAGFTRRPSARSLPTDE